MHRTDAPTTPDERRPRVQHLYEGAEPAAVQTLLEIAVGVLGDEGELPGPVRELAAQIEATFEPEVPEFEIGDEVWLEAPDPKRRIDTGVKGKIVDRQLSEKSIRREGNRLPWVYQARVMAEGGGLYGGPMYFDEDKLAPVEVG
jgi:hypothetical protein